MSFAERLVVWNRWYDSVPEGIRFQFVLWSLIGLGTINMLLTIAVGFPFALLVVLGIIVIAIIRLPHAMGWVTHAEGPVPEARFQIAGAGRLVELNRRYEALPEPRRIWVYPAVLLIGGAINMMLTIAYGFPFGLMFLLTLLALVAVRAPYAAGWLGTSGGPDADRWQAGGAVAVGHASMVAIASEPPPVVYGAPASEHGIDHPADQRDSPNGHPEREGSGPAASPGL